MRFLEKRLWFVRYMVRDKTIKVIHIPGDSNRADMLTKPLGTNEFKRKRGLLLTSLSDIQEQMSPGPTWPVDQGTFKSKPSQPIRSPKRRRLSKVESELLP